MTGRKALCPEFTFGTSKGPYLHEALGTVLQGSQAGETRFIPNKGGITFAITSKAALNCVQNSESMVKKG